MASPQYYVLITGGNTGVGYETAKILLQSGRNYHVLLGSRSLAKGEDAAKSLRESITTTNKVTPIQLDVTSEDSIAAAKESIQGMTDYVNCVVNNAGRMSHISPVTAALRETMDTNVVGSVAVTEAFKDMMIESSDPRLIFVSSSLGSLNGASNPQSPYYQSVTGHQWLEYRMSKAAINMAMITYGKTLKKYGVKVWGADPGPNQTGLLGSMKDEIVKHVGEERVKMIPHPSKGGKVLADCVLGERDADVNKVVGSYGIGEW